MRCQPGCGTGSMFTAVLTRMSAHIGLSRAVLFLYRAVGSGQLKRPGLQN